MKHTAFLLAAGFGSRLRPLTNTCPKPLLPICGIPMADYALAQLRAHGHSHVLVNAHHLWQQVAAWAESRGVALQVELPEVLGTGGGLAAAADRLAERVTVFNGDILCDVDLTALQEACPVGGASMALRAVAELGGITPVRCAADGTVQRIGDIAAVAGAPAAARQGPGVHFTGIHTLHHQAIDRIPPAGFSCVVRTAYRSLVPEGRVRGLMHRGAWVDVGTPARYLQANLDALDGALALSIDPWSQGTRGPGGSWVGAGAQVHGRIARCVIGAGAVVPAGAHLTDCVVWDGVVVPAGALHRAVIPRADGVLVLG